MSVLEITAEAPPIRTDSDGSMRIGTTRALLDIVVGAYQDGATPEAILQQYSTLGLSDVYAVISYYLRHRAQVDAYLAQRDVEADELRVRIEAKQRDLTGIRTRLLARLGESV